MADIDPSDIRPCNNQVGGHMSKDQKPDMFTDSKGRFYKPFQGGLRAARELAFYVAVYPKPDSKPTGPARPVTAEEAGDEVAGPPAAAEDVAGLQPFISPCYGTVEHDGRSFLVMEDICAGYDKPCVLDVKLGFKSVYDWAEQSYLDKNIPKDKETTQATVGFRISGAQVYKQKEGEMHKTDRQWGKTLTADTMDSAFQLFASNGAISAEQLYRGSGGFLEQLRKLEAWAISQSSFQFYQASVLLVYEGTAADVASSNIKVRLIDFAHTFGANATPPAPGDPSFLRGLQSLIGILERVQ